MQAREDDTGKYFSNDAQERDAPVIVAVAAVSFVFIQSDDVGVSHILGDIALFPAKAEELMQGLDQCFFTALQDFRWDAITPRSFPTREAVDGFAELLPSRGCIKLLHDRQVWGGVQGGVRVNVPEHCKHQNDDIPPL